MLENKLILNNAGDRNLNQYFFNVESYRNKGIKIELEKLETVFNKTKSIHEKYPTKYIS